MSTSISQHEGKKYLRLIRSAEHTIKKLLCAGERDKGDELSDLIGALAAVNRAIELQREESRGDTVNK